MKRKMRPFYVYVTICVILELLSLIGLFFNIWEITCTLGIGIVFAIVYYFLLQQGMNFIKPNDESSVGLFYLFTLLRFLCILVGILIPALILYLTRGDTSKWRYLYLIISTVPFLGVTLFMALEKNRNKGVEDAKN